MQTEGASSAGGRGRRLPCTARVSRSISLAPMATGDTPQLPNSLSWAYFSQGRPSQRERNAAGSTPTKTYFDIFWRQKLMEAVHCCGRAEKHIVCANASNFSGKLKILRTPPFLSSPLITPDPYVSNAPFLHPSCCSASPSSSNHLASPELYAAGLSVLYQNLLHVRPKHNLAPLSLNPAHECVDQGFCSSLRIVQHYTLVVSQKHVGGAERKGDWVAQLFQINSHFDRAR